MSLARVVAVALAAHLGTAGCVADSGGPLPAPATILISASVVGTAVATVVVAVGAPDIPTPLVFNLTVANGVASGEITVPAGSSRTITVRAYDAGGIQTHTGATTVNTAPGTTLTLSLTLTPLTGDIDLEIALGRLTVTVSPPSGSLAAGGTLQLATAITDANGAPAAGPVAWATADPATATVDGSGLVTGIAPGQVAIVATFGGAAGQSILTVTAP